MIEMSAAAKVDGILTQGLTNREFKPAIDHAVNQGVPVITFDTDLEESKRFLISERIITRPDTKSVKRSFKIQMVRLM